jgi:hypothetical protein
MPVMHNWEERSSDSQTCFLLGFRQCGGEQQAIEFLAEVHFVCECASGDVMHAQVTVESDRAQKRQTTQYTPPHTNTNIR